MRAVFALSPSVGMALVMLACGGTKKPAESAEGPSEPSTTLSGDTIPEADAAAAETPAASSQTTEAPPAASAPADTPAPAAPAETAPAHPVPTVTGSIDGKPFSPKMAHITRPMMKDGRIVISVDERTECGGGDARPGEAVLSMTVPWEDGYKADLGSLRGGKKKAGDIAFVRVGANGKKQSPAAFKPTGRATIVKAPTEENSVGKMNIDLQSGDYMLSGDLDIQVCVSPKATAAAPVAAKAPKPTKKGKKK